MADSARVEKYERFVNQVLKEDLRRVLEERDKLFQEIADYSQLRQTLECVQQAPCEDGLRTQVDLGSNFYVQAHVPDVSKIYVNIGLGFHVELTQQEALKFIEKKLKELNEKVAESTKQSAKIKGQIKFVYEGLRQIEDLGRQAE